jgi:hypothetical protein
LLFTYLFFTFLFFHNFFPFFPPHLSVAKSVGADDVINYNTHDLRKEVDRITGGAFADVIYEIVGGATFEQSLRCITPRGGGRLLVIGFASGHIPSVPANLPLIKGLLSVSFTSLIFILAISFFFLFLSFLRVFSRRSTIWCTITITTGIKCGTSQELS